METPGQAESAERVLRTVAAVVVCCSRSCLGDGRLRALAHAARQGGMPVLLFQLEPGLALSGWLKDVLWHQPSAAPLQSLLRVHTPANASSPGGAAGVGACAAAAPTIMRVVRELLATHQSLRRRQHDALLPVLGSRSQTATEQHLRSDDRAVLPRAISDEVRPQFRDQSMRDIGKSQSIWTASKMETSGNIGEPRPAQPQSADCVDRHDDEDGENPADAPGAIGSQWVQTPRHGNPIVHDEEGHDESPPNARSGGSAPLAVNPPLPPPLPPPPPQQQQYQPTAFADRPRTPAVSSTGAGAGAGAGPTAKTSFANGQNGVGDAVRLPVARGDMPGPSPPRAMPPSGAGDSGDSDSDFESDDAAADPPAFDGGTRPDSSIGPALQTTAGTPAAADSGSDFESDDEHPSAMPGLLPLRAGSASIVAPARRLLHDEERGGPEQAAAGPAQVEAPVVPSDLEEWLVAALSRCAAPARVKRPFD
jgi:hypothetical protein